MKNTVENPAVLIVSDAMDFAQPLAQQIQNELKVTCKIVKTAQEIKHSTLLVVHDEAAYEGEANVLKLDSPPYRMQALLDKIAMMLQKQSADEIPIARNYRLLPRQKELQHVASGEMTSLTDKEVKLLQCLYEAVGNPVLKDHLLRKVWEMEVELDTHTLETHIYRLRAKFRDLGGEEVITAVDGGYCLPV